MGFKKVSILIKHLYGRDLYYPDCHFAEFICWIAGTKTLSERMLAVVREEGYEVELRRESLPLSDGTEAAAAAKEEV